MSIIDRIFGDNQPQEKQVPQPTATVGFAGNAIAPEKNTRQHLEAYKNISWIYRAVNKNASKTAEIELRLMRHVANSKRTSRTKGVDMQGDVEIVDNHPSLDLLSSVNDFMTLRDLIFSTQAYLELVGEMYWVLLPDAKNPKEIWPLRPDKVEIKPSDDEYISKYIYKPRYDIEVEFEPGQIIPFKEFDPVNPFRGVGAVMAVAYAGDADLFAAKWNRNFFYNQAIPLLALLMKDNMSSASIRRFEEDWENKYKGVDNAFKTAIIKGVESIVTNIGTSHKDMDFLEQRRFNRDEILAIFGVPKGVAGIVEDVNRANMEASRYSWLEGEIKPKMTKIVDVLTEFLLRRYSDASGMYFDFVDPVPDNKEVDLQFYQAQGVPWMTPNEIRQREGMEDLPGDIGDHLYIPFNLQKSDATNNNPQKKLTFKSGRGHVPMKRPGFKEKERIMEDMKSRKKEIVQAMSQFISTPQERTKEIDQENTKDYKEMVWKQFIDVQENFLDNYESIAIKLFNEQRDDVIAKLQNKPRKSTKKQTLAELFDLEAWIDATKDQFRPVILQLVKSQGMLSMDQVGTGVFDTSTPAIKDFIDNEGLKFAREINETTQQNIKQALKDSVDEGLGTDETANKIRESFDGVSQSRAETIARTETIKASNFARVESYSQAGITKHEWFPALDERVRDAHAQAGGQIVGINEKFNVGGEELAYPGDPNGSADNIINCRCTVLAVYD